MADSGCVRVDLLGSGNAAAAKGGAIQQTQGFASVVGDEMMVTVINDSMELPADRGMSKPIGFWGVIKATVIKDLVILKRYRANLIGGLVEIGILVASFFLFSTVIDFRSENIFAEGTVDQGMFIFFLAGIIIMLFQNTALYMPVNTTRRDLYNGTLEYIYSGPSSRYAYLLGSIVADALIRMIFIGPLIVLLFVVAEASANYLAILGVVTVFLLVITSIGVLISLMAIMWKQVGNLVGIIGILTQFIGGAFLPVQSFPEMLKWVAYLMPFTYAYDLVRFYAFGGNWNPVLPVALEWGILLVNAVFFALLSRSLLRRVERYTKNQGLHLI